jgi:hypothetical protein
MSRLSKMNHLRRLVYPVGAYHEKYSNFAAWSFASNMIVSTQSVLSVHSMLAAVDTSSSNAVRTANYVGKDIIGQLGGLGYMSRMGQKSDQEPRKFLRYANIIQQSSYMMTSITPLIPEYFLVAAGSANIMANISYTCFGAINAKCIQKLATDGNTGEVYAKICVLNTLGSSIGMMTGLCITTLIPDHSTRLCLIPILGAARIYTFNKAIEGLIE